MKKCIVSIAFLLLLLQSFGQSSVEPVFSKSDYLQKSKNKKTGAWVLLGGGTAVLAFTAISAASSVDFSHKSSFPVVPVAIGSAMMLGSVPLFIAAVQNKKRSIDASAYFQIQKTQSMEQGGISFHSFPAIAIKLRVQ